MRAILLASVAAVVAAPVLAQDRADVLNTYADIAEAKYTDSLVTAQALQSAVDALIANPSAEALEAAKHAWLASRVP
ncbi:MAG: imelysin family protein, partial [Pseudomonadota bacterium]